MLTWLIFLALLKSPLDSAPSINNYNSPISNLSLSWSFFYNHGYAGVRSFFFFLFLCNSYAIFAFGFCYYCYVSWTEVMESRPNIRFMSERDRFFVLIFKALCLRKLWNWRLFDCRRLNCVNRPGDLWDIMSGCFCFLMYWCVLGKNKFLISLLTGGLI